jgi:glucosamine kinase
VSRCLLIDGGQSGCRVAYVVDGERVGSASGSGLSRQSGDRTTGVLRALERALAEIEPRPDAVDAVGVGLTGFDGSPESAREISDGIRSLVRAERVSVTSDDVTSYLGAVGLEPGAVAAAGTGAIALAGDLDGNHARGDGWGYILGDEGSGYYVGRRGLASALRAHEGRGGSEALWRLAEARLGTPGLIKQRVYGAPNPASEVAAFARAVAEAAREGDAEAAGIWAAAAREVASTTVATLRRVFDPGYPAAVSWTGGLFEARDLMLEPFKRHVTKLWPTAQLLAPKGTALDGAELLARSDTTPMFGPLVYRF